MTRRRDTLSIRRARSPGRHDEDDHLITESRESKIRELAPLETVLV
jgi:hypothetical protein